MATGPGRYKDREHSVFLTCTRIWNLKNQDLMDELELEDFEALTVALARNAGNDSLFSAYVFCDNQDLLVWPDEQFDCPFTIRGKGKPPNELRSKLCSLAVSADCHYAVSSGNNLLHVWDLKDRSCVASLEGFKGQVRDVTVSADERHALVATKEAEIQLRSLQENTIIGTLHGNILWESFAVTPDGTYAVSSGGHQDDDDLDQMEVWDLKAPAAVRRVAVLRDQPGMLFQPGAVKAAANTDGGQIVTMRAQARGDPYLQLWDMTSW